MSLPAFIAASIGLGVLLGLVLDGVGQIWGLITDLVDSLGPKGGP